MNQAVKEAIDMMADRANQVVPPDGLARRISAIPPAEWAGALSELSDTQLRALGKQAAALCVTAAMLEAYALQRGADGRGDQGHEAGVEAARTACVAARTYLAYMDPASGAFDF